MSTLETSAMPSSLRTPVKGEAPSAAAPATSAAAATKSPLRGPPPSTPFKAEGPAAPAAKKRKRALPSAVDAAAHGALGASPLSYIGGAAAAAAPGEPKAKVKRDAEEKKPRKPRAIPSEWPLPPCIARTPELQLAVDAASVEFTRMKVPELDKLLKANGMLRGPAVPGGSASKAALVDRCVEGKLLGPPTFPCPSCRHGFLWRRNEGSSEYSCLGYYSRDNDGNGGFSDATYNSCNYSVAHSALKRGKWRQPGEQGDLSKKVDSVRRAALSPQS